MRLKKLAKAIRKELDGGDIAELLSALEALDGKESTRAEEPKPVATTRAKAKDLQRAGKVVARAGRDMHKVLAMCQYRIDSAPHEAPPGGVDATIARFRRIIGFFKSGHYHFCEDSPDCLMVAVGDARGCGCRGIRPPAAARRRPADEPELEDFWINWVATREIELTWEGAREELELAAYQHWCDLRARDNKATGWSLNETDPPTMHRLMANYIRHNHSNYTGLVRGKRRAVGNALRKRFHAAISERYDIPLASLEDTGAHRNDPVRNATRESKQAVVNAHYRKPAVMKVQEAADGGRGVEEQCEPQAGPGTPRIPAADGVSGVKEVEAAVLMCVTKAEAVCDTVKQQQGRLRVNWGRPFVRHHEDGGASVVLPTSRGEKYFAAVE